jgi:hypothetical protein
MFFYTSTIPISTPFLHYLKKYQEENNEKKKVFTNTQNVMKIKYKFMVYVSVNKRGFVLI